MITILNFSHDYTAAATAAVAALVDDTVEVLNLPSRFDLSGDLRHQVSQFLDSLEFGGWEGRILRDLPGHSAVAALILAEAHGRRGRFPRIVRRLLVDDQYDGADVIALSDVREAGASKRTSGT